MKNSPKQEKQPKKQYRAKALASAFQLLNSRQRQLLRAQLVKKGEGKEESHQRLRLLDRLIKNDDVERPPRRKKGEQGRPASEVGMHMSNAVAGLFDMVMDALRDEEATNAREFRFHKAISNAKLLLHLSLNEEANEILQQAKLLAIETDRPDLLIEVNGLLRKVALNLRPKDLTAQLDKLAEEDTSAKELWDHCLGLDALVTQLTNGDDLIKKSILPTVKTMAQGQPDPTKSRSFRYLRLFYIVQAAYHNLVVRSAELLDEARILHLRYAFESHQQKILLYDRPEFLHFRDEEPEFFLDDITKFLAFCVFNYHLDAFEEALNRMPARVSEVEAFRTDIYLQMMMYARVNQFEALRARCTKENWEERLEKVGKTLPQARLIVLYLQMTEMFFYTEDWPKVEHWALKIQHNTARGFRLEVKMIAAVMEIIARAEQGEFINNPSGGRYLIFIKKRYAREYKRLRFYKICLRFLTELMESEGSLSAKSLRKWFAEIKEIMNDFPELDFYEFLLIWLRGRVKATGTLSELALEEFTRKHKPSF